LLAALARIPHRLGYDVPEVAPFLTQALPFDPDTHAARLNLDLVGTMDDGRRTTDDGRSNQSPLTTHYSPLTTHPSSMQSSMQFPVTADEHAAAQAWLAERGVGSGERVIAVHAGAGAAVKLWTTDGWARVADTWAQAGYRIILTGSLTEAPLAADIVRQMRQPVLNAAGQTDLGLLAALLARCSLVIGPDAGALHLATAVGAPTVRLYGPINPRQFGPWGDPARHRVVLADPPLACQFCERLDYPDHELPLHPCVRWIRVDQVLAAAREVVRGLKDEG
jgi:heptosyltransferase-2/heptosyltransferase-3